MKITLDLNKSIEENAAAYYERVKKLKRKLEGAERVVEETGKKIDKLKKEQLDEKEEKIDRKKEWYEKFRWFFSSEGILCIGGRDATTNEIIIKKHAEKDDLVFHTDMAGSPFFLTKGSPGEATIRECADATVTFSKVWKLGMSSASVFYVNPEQVTKEAQSGEYLPKGAFMIKGRTTYVDNKVNLAVGNYKGAIMAGPEEAVKAHCEKVILLEQGKEKVSAVAKKIKRQVGGDLDEIIRVLPVGLFSIRRS